MSVVVYAKKIAGCLIPLYWVCFEYLMEKRVRRLGPSVLRYVRTKSLYRSRAGRHFYGTENVIWAGFGPIGNTEKKSLG